MYYLGEHELNIFGSMMYIHEDYEAAVNMISTGRIIIDPIYSKSLPFEQYLEAYRYIELKGDRSMKVMIDL
jgi:threonine dehydrogenase-like Zn-dependent dehydrogenase